MREVAQTTAGVLPVPSADGWPGPPFSPRLIVLGFLTLAICLAALGAWSWLAPLRSAVIAPGLVSVDTYRKKVQHLEGGIIDEILVREGEHVRAGQVLVRIRNVAPMSTVSRLRAQYFEALAISARAHAERDNRETIQFSEELLGSDSPEAQEAVKGQSALFESRRELFKQTVRVMEQKKLQAEEEQGGLKGRLDAIGKQLEFYEAELKDAQTLYEKKLMPRSRLLGLQRDNSARQGERSTVEGRIAEVRQQILEYDLKITELKAARISEAEEKLREYTAKAFELSQRLVAAEDIRRRTEVRSPMDGTVVDMQVHTRDGVVSPGQTMMEIVPSSDRLVVEARLRPEDRDEVRVGLETYVQLTTASRRDPRPIKGVLESISADRLIDKDTDKPYYRIRVILEPESVKQQKMEVIAGMGADVFVQTGERTPFDYLKAPIARTFQRGLREK